MMDFLKGIDWLALAATGAIGLVVALIYAFVAEDADMLTAVIFGVLAGVALPLTYEVGDKLVFA